MREQPAGNGSPVDICRPGPGDAPAYVVIGRFEGGTNFNLLLREAATGDLWVAKFFLNGHIFQEGYADLNDRETLAWRLACLIDTCIPEMCLVPLNRIEFSYGFNNLIEGLGSKVILQKSVLLTRYAGITLHNYLKLAPLDSIVNLDELTKSFAFNLWIGNYDRKEGDYSVNQDCRGYSIDYSLCGPGFVDDLDLSIGAYFQSYDFRNSSDSGWALPDILLDWLRYQNPGEIFFSDIVGDIEGVSDRDIDDAFHGLKFHRMGTSKPINAAYKDYLKSRRDGLRSAVSTWCSHGYPKGHRMQEF